MGNSKCNGDLISHSEELKKLDGSILQVYNEFVDSWARPENMIFWTRARWIAHQKELPPTPAIDLKLGAIDETEGGSSSQGAHDEEGRFMPGDEGSDAPGRRRLCLANSVVALEQLLH